MIPKPIISVVLANRFRQDVKRLLKKYRHVREDVQNLITQLEQGDTPGDRIQNTHYLVYKVRLRNTDLQKGKSSGYRAIYYIKTAEKIVLITLYIKSERTDIPDGQIQQLIEDFEAED